jgi:DNA-binding response OmpR family regulator
MAKKILIVEDDADIVEIINMALQKQGYEVYIAYTGVVALNKLITKPDLILLDLMLPELDGRAVNLRLKENPETKDIPVIVMTGKGHLREVFDIKEGVNVAAYLEKPFPIKVLLDKISELLSKQI